MFIYVLAENNEFIGRCRLNSPQLNWLVMLSDFRLNSSQSPQRVLFDFEKLKETLISYLTSPERVVILPPPFKGPTYDSSIPTLRMFLGTQYTFYDTHEDLALLFLLNIFEEINRRDIQEPSLDVFLAKNDKEYRDYLERLRCS